MFTKICTYCDKPYHVLKIEEFAKYFHVHKLGKYGFTAKCKGCRKRTEKKQKKPSKAKVKEKKPCVVCGNDFTPRRYVDEVCSKTCSKFRTKISLRLNRHRYELKTKNLAMKEKKRTNSTKPYTQKEIEFIFKNRGILEIKEIARRLNRTTRAIILLISKRKTI